MSISIGDVLLKLGLDTSEWEKGLKDINKQATDAAKSISDSFGGIGKASLAIGGSITAAMGLSIKGAVDEEQAMLRLRASLKNVGVEFDNVKTPLDATIMSLEKMSAVSHDQLYSAFTKLINITGNYDDALSLLPLALDLSKGASIDLDTASMLVGKVMEGNTSLLSRYGIVLKEGATKTEALDAITKRFGGSAETMGKSTGSAMERIKLSIDTLSEGIGVIFLPLLTSVSNVTSWIIDRTTEWTEKNPLLTAAITGVTAALGLLLLGLGTYVTLSRSATVQATLHIVKLGLQTAATWLATAAQWALNAAMSANPIGIIIILIAALTAGIIALFKNWGKGAKDAAAATQAAAKETTESLRTELRKQLQDELDLAEKKKAIVKNVYDAQVQAIKDYYGESKHETQSLIQLAMDARDAKIRALDDEADKATQNHNERIRQLEDEYQVNLGAEERILQDQVDAIDEQTRLEDLALARAEEQKRLATLTGKEYDEYAAEIARNELLRQRDAQKRAIREQIDAIRDGTAEIAQKLRAATDENIRLANEELKAKLDSLATQKDEADKSLAADIVRIETKRDAELKSAQKIYDDAIQKIADRETALKDDYNAVEKATQIHINNMNQITAQLQDRTVTITTIERTVTEGGGDSSGVTRGFASGGLITEPTLLTRVGQSMPYGIMAERGPERISPVGYSGFRTANITVQINGRDLIRILGQPLVDDIRLRTGLRGL